MVKQNSLQMTVCVQKSVESCHGSKRIRITSGAFEIRFVNGFLSELEQTLDECSHTEVRKAV